MGANQDISVVKNPVFPLVVGHPFAVTASLIEFLSISFLWIIIFRFNNFPLSKC
jgi:hypothetical protein